MAWYCSYICRHSLGLFCILSGNILERKLWWILIAFWVQEEKCKQIIESFRKIVPQHARIVRDGVIQVVKVEDIVVGDIVLIKAGDKVPADMRLFEADKLYV